MDFITDIEEPNPSSSFPFHIQTQQSSNPEFISLTQRKDILEQEHLKQKVKKDKQEQDIQKKKRLFINKKANNYSHQNKSFKQPLQSSNKEKELLKEQNDLKEIKNYYLGIKKEKKKEVRPKENSKDFFVFNWRESEDTSLKDTQSITNMQNRTSVLFGRGHLGGIDPQEIQKQSKHYQELMQSYQDKQYLNNKRERSLSKDNINNKYKDKNKNKNNHKSQIESREIHWSSKTIKEMTERDYRIFREDNDIIIKGGKAPKPIRKWTESSLSQSILTKLNEENISQPTSVQMQCIPIAFQHQDFIGLAPTGSGKTLAFLLPLITHINSLPSVNIEQGPYALILTPTRELAIQINEQFIKYSKGTKLKSACIIGGKNAEDQAIELGTGVEVIIATPGRLKEALERQFTILTQCQWVILDEADKMIGADLGDNLNCILENLPTSTNNLNVISKGNYTTMMFSATMNTTLEKIARTYLKNPLYISIGEPGSGKKDIEQRIEMLSEDKKKERTRSIVNRYSHMIIIFLNHKHRIDSFVKYLEKNRINAIGMHGGKSQENREKALNGFKNGKYDVLVCTSVLARGIDVEGVKVVINADCPMSIEDYNHRIGRTGRAGLKGIAYTFLTENDEEMFYDIREYLEKNDQKVPEDLKDHPASMAKKGNGGSNRNKVIGSEKSFENNYNNDDKNEDDHFD